MADGTGPLARCGIDTLEIARVERLLLGTPHEDRLRIFSKEELCDLLLGREERIRRRIFAQR